MEHSLSQLALKDKELIDSLYSKNEEALKEYADLLIWWNKKINLVSRDVSRETVLLHIRHSLYVSLSAEFGLSKKIIDTGAGGGVAGYTFGNLFS